MGGDPDEAYRMANSSEIIESGDGIVDRAARRPSGVKSSQGRLGVAEDLDEAGTE